MSNPKAPVNVPKWVTEAIEAYVGDADLDGALHHGALFGAKLILEKLALTAEKDWSDESEETYFYNTGRRSVRDEVAGG